MRKSFCLIAIALLATLPVAAADNVIYSGIDLWKTTDDGSTQTDFSRIPIPADFFCTGSSAFTGLIKFRGVPLVTSPANTLGSTDTIVHRLDDATFDEKGSAFTRVQVRAMTFESLAPVETVCGSFDVRVVLDGEQPITKMQILRDDEKGGRFFSPISVDVKLAFLPSDGRKHETLEITRSLDFQAMPDGRWTESTDEGQVASKSSVLVDTDGDSEPDTFLPGTSNFSAKTSELGQKAVNGAGCHCDFETCGHLHCIGSVPIDDDCGAVANACR